MEPLVTVFIPLYNSEKYIKECLDSVINQTYTNLEILIVNDGSTDHSYEIIKNNYNDSRIRLLNNHENKGLPFTRNRGLSEARGEFFALLDSDDIALPHRIQRQVEAFQMNPNVAVVTSGYQVFSGKFKKAVVNYKSPLESKISLIFGNHICNPSSMLKIESFKKYNITYNLNCFVAQDYDLWANISKYEDIYNIPEVFVKYRIGHENISKTSRLNKMEQRFQIISNIKNDLLDYYNFELDLEEKLLFNIFFGEQYPKVEFIDENKARIETLIAILVTKNKKLKLFDDEIFNRIIFEKVSNIIGNLDISLSRKLKYYDFFLGEKYKLKTKVIKRHFYLFVRNTLRVKL